MKFQDNVKKSTHMTFNTLSCFVKSQRLLIISPNLQNNKKTTQQ